VAGSRTCVTVTVVEATLTVPVLARPLFAATLNVAAPLPLPLAPDVMVIQDALLWAVQVQPLGAETDTDAPVPPPNGNDCDCAFTVYEHEGAGGGVGGGTGGAGGVGVGVGAGGDGVGASPTACVTVNGCSAMVIVPVLAPCEFGATRNSTVPLPSPLADDAIVIQEALLLAVHPQPWMPVTVTVPVPPRLPNSWFVDAIVNWHVAASCRT
jgi:hypothetical protein